MTRPKRILGLTGGIGAGKSTVSALLSELGCHIVCADDLARRVVAPGAPALDEIATRFGPEFLTDKGELDRQRMGELVFSTPSARRDLEAILHPRIREAFHRAVRHSRQDNPDRVVVYDAPLLLEVGADKEVTRVVVVDVDRATQIARVVARDGLTEAEAARRIDAQMDRQQRLARADHVIDGTAPLETIRLQLQRIVAALENS